MTVWVDSARLTFSNGWLEDIWRGFFLILADGTREIKSKEKHIEYFIYHLKGEPYLNAAFWPYCGLLQSEIQESANISWRYHAASSATISSWI